MPLLRSAADSSQIMSTHCAIIQKIPGHGYRGIYCHLDGCYSHNPHVINGVGSRLEAYYTNPDEVDRLMQIGDINALYNNAFATLLGAYKHDNGGVESKGFRFATSITHVLRLIGLGLPEYVWVFDGHKWHDKSVLHRRALNTLRRRRASVSA
jgi:hypothetical protein